MADVPTLENPGTSVTRPSVFGHVLLRTTPDRFPAMVKFYKTLLSAEASFENEHIALLTYDHEHHRVAIAALNGTTEPATKSAGLQHISFSFKDLSELALVYLQRKQHGLEPFWCVNHGMTMSMYYRDPDGHAVESQADMMTPEESTAFMSGPLMAKNPIGMDFDPEDLVARLKNGESEKSIARVEGVWEARNFSQVPV